MTKGRRLRLDRRKAGLSQEELAKQLGHTQDEISAMENDRLDLSPAAEQFSANLPARVPRGPGKARVKPEASEKAGEQEPPAEEPGPQPAQEPQPEEPKDRAPRPQRAQPREILPPRGEIALLEDALLKMFAGERLIVPKQTPDGVIQVEAVIPGIAQAVSMFDEFDGRIIETYSPGMAKAWAELARVNPAVRRVLMGLTYGGAYRGVLAASLPPMIAILAHHGALPGFGDQGGQPVGPPPPEPAPSEDGVPPGGVPVEVEALFDQSVGT